ncbi:Hypothetical predicted protein, partial [Marmota monax]
VLVIARGFRNMPLEHDKENLRRNMPKTQLHPSRGDYCNPIMDYGTGKESWEQ